jgi:hypothetical protein
MKKRNSQKRYSERSGEESFQSKKVKEDDDVSELISSSNSYAHSYQAGPLMSATTNNISSSSDWNAFGEQSSSNARQVYESTSNSSSSDSTGLLLSGASVSGHLSQLLSSDMSKRKPMIRYEMIAELETGIRNRNAQLTKLEPKLESLKEDRRQIMKLEKKKRNKDYLVTIENDIKEKEADKARLLAEIAEHDVKLNDLRKAATILEAPQSGICLSIYYILFCLTVSYPVLPFPIIS